MRSSASRSCRAIGCSSRSRSGVCRTAIARARALARIDGAIVAEAQLVWGWNGSAGARAARTPTSTRRAIVHPGAEIGAGTIVGPFATIGEYVRIGTRLPDRRVGGDRRVDRDRRRQRDLSDGLCRARPAGPEVRRRADARRDRRAQHHPRVRDDSSRHGRRRRRDDDRVAQPAHGLHAHRARLPRRQRDDLRQRRDAGGPRARSRTSPTSARTPASTSSAASATTPSSAAIRW